LTPKLHHVSFYCTQQMYDIKILSAIPYLLGIVWVALGSLSILFNISALKSLLLLIYTLFPLALWLVSRVNNLRSFFSGLSTHLLSGSALFPLKRSITFLHMQNKETPILW